jgi:hypothetical protein
MPEEGVQRDVPSEVRRDYGQGVHVPRERGVTDQYAPEEFRPVRTPCGAKVRVYNRTQNDLKVVYIWDSTKMLLVDVSKDGATDVEPIYCPSQLSVLTGEKVTSNVVVEPGRSYEIAWSAEQKQYLVRLVKPPAPPKDKAVPLTPRPGS